MSDRTRLEYFAAAALTGLLAHDFDWEPTSAAHHAVKQAKALADEIDRQFDPDYAEIGEGPADA